LFLLSLFLLCSCGSTASVERSGHVHILQEPEVTVRSVAVTVLSPDPRHFDELTALVAEASGQLFEQTGIAVHVNSYQAISWQSSDRAGMLQQVADRMKNSAGAYDITLAYAPMSAGQTLSFFIFGGWEGIIDDVYRRHIVLRTKDSRVLLHELVHAFLFSETHTTGLMSASRICVIPGVACFNGSSHLSERDTNEVLQNKWRDFSSKVHVAFVEDRISDGEESPGTFQ
jgi:hypothetical protein